MVSATCSVCDMICYEKAIQCEQTGLINGIKLPIQKFGDRLRSPKFDVSHLNFTK